VPFLAGPASVQRDRQHRVGADGRQRGGSTGAAGSNLYTTAAAIAASFAAGLGGTTTYANEGNGDDHGDGGGGYAGKVKGTNRQYGPMGGSHSEANDAAEALAKAMGLSGKQLKKVRKYLHWRKRQEEKPGSFHDEDWARQVIQDFIDGDYGGGG
jgi:hypothetical protein